MTPWDPAREELVAIWDVLYTLREDVAALKDAVYGTTNRQDRDD